MTLGYPRNATVFGVESSKVKVGVGVRVHIGFELYECLLVCNDVLFVWTVTAY